MLRWPTLRAPRIAPPLEGFRGLAVPRAGRYGHSGPATRGAGCGLRKENQSSWQAHRAGPGGARQGGTRGDAGEAPSGPGSRRGSRAVQPILLTAVNRISDHRLPPAGSRLSAWRVSRPCERRLREHGTAAPACCGHWTRTALLRPRSRARRRGRHLWCPIRGAGGRGDSDSSLGVPHRNVTSPPKAAQGGPSLSPNKTSITR